MPEVADILRSFAGGDISAQDVLEQIAGTTEGVDVDRALWTLSRSDLHTIDDHLISSLGIHVGPYGLSGPSASISLLISPAPCLPFDSFAALAGADQPGHNWGPPTRVLVAQLPNRGSLTVSAPDAEPACVHQIIARGPESDAKPAWAEDHEATKQLAETLAEIAAGGELGLQELRRWFVLDEITLSTNSAPQQHLTTGALRGAPATRFDMMLGPARSNPLRTLRAYPWLGGSYPCIGIDGLKALWGWDTKPVPPIPPHHGAGPIRKLHAGKLSGVEVSLGSREEAFQCASSIFMVLPR